VPRSTSAVAVPCRLALATRRRRAGGRPDQGQGDEGATGWRVITGCACWSRTHAAQLIPLAHEATLGPSATVPAHSSERRCRWSAMKAGSGGTLAGIRREGRVPRPSRAASRAVLKILARINAPPDSASGRRQPSKPASTASGYSVVVAWARSPGRELPATDRASRQVAGRDDAVSRSPFARIVAEG